MSKLFEDLDQLMMPYRCVHKKVYNVFEWREIIKWLDATCGKNKWYADRNEICFAKEAHLTMFLLRWA